jgi:hypothetical protein
MSSHALMEVVMRQWFHVTLLFSAILWAVGCSDNRTPTPSQKPVNTVTQPNPSPPPVSPQPSVPPGETGTAAVQPATTPQPPTPPASAAPAAPEPSPPAAARPAAIQLSTGVALPQTGPEGTLMGFHIDYEFVQGQPDSEGYIWIIERAHGAPAKQQVKVSGKGELYTLVPGWRPEHGPFQSHIEDRKGNKLSESIELRQQGE